MGGYKGYSDILRQLMIIKDNLNGEILFPAGR
jgi:hypothetical protein